MLQDGLFAALTEPQKRLGLTVTILRARGRDEDKRSIFCFALGSSALARKAPKSVRPPPHVSTESGTPRADLRRAAFGPCIARAYRRQECNSGEDKKDIYRRITNQIIGEPEIGVRRRSRTRQRLQRVGEDDAQAGRRPRRRRAQGRGEALSSGPNTASAWRLGPSRSVLGLGPSFRRLLG